MVRMGEFAGIAVFSADRLIRKAITTASPAAGQKVEGGERIPVHVSNPADGRRPRMQSTDIDENPD